MIMVFIRLSDPQIICQSPRLDHGLLKGRSFFLVICVFLRACTYHLLMIWKKLGLWRGGRRIEKWIKGKEGKKKGRRESVCAHALSHRSLWVGTGVQHQNDRKMSKRGHLWVRADAFHTPNDPATSLTNLWYSIFFPSAALVARERLSSAISWETIICYFTDFIKS